MSLYIYIWYEDKMTKGEKPNHQIQVIANISATLVHCYNDLPPVVSALWYLQKPETFQCISP